MPKFNRLRPCPFCGSKKVTLWKDEVDGETVWCVFCEDCEAEGPHAKGAKTAVKRWESRVVYHL